MNYLVKFKKIFFFFLNYIYNSPTFLNFFTKFIKRKKSIDIEKWRNMEKYLIMKGKNGIIYKIVFLFVSIFTLNLPWASENIDETVPYPDLE